MCSVDHIHVIKLGVLSCCTSFSWVSTLLTLSHYAAGYLYPEKDDEDNDDDDKDDVAKS